jgi:hypothetical protein
MFFHDPRQLLGVFTQLEEQNHFLVQNVQAGLPSIRLSVRPSSGCLPVCPYVHMSVCPSVRPSVCPSVGLSVCLSACLPVHMSVRLSVRPSIYLSACLPVERVRGRWGALREAGLRLLSVRLILGSSACSSGV